jgi:adenine/guanine phosphoribosyltransferase-like PRPP-binding protein
VGDYEYELRNGDAVIATGRIQLEVAPAPGETLSLGSQLVLVDDVLRLGGTPRLILMQPA